MSTGHSEPEPAPASLHQSARGKARPATLITLLMLSVVIGTCLTLDAMANLSQVQDWIRRVSWEQARSKKLIPLFCTTNHFIDAEDRLLHGQIPAADFSRGGIYFVGASNMTWALRLWDQEPAAARPLIDNYGIIGANHAELFDMIRFLTESEGLLEAGGEKTLILIAADYHLCHEARINVDVVKRLESVWGRRGFYSVDPAGVIHRSGLHPLFKTIIRERAKITGLLKEVVNIAYVPFKTPRVLTPQFYNDEWTRTMKPDWQQRVKVDLASFAAMVEYLQSRGAEVQVIFMPRGSWEDNVPFEKFYNQRLSEICAADHVKIHDFSRLVPDDEFADSVHLAPGGIEKFQAAVMPICLDQLRKTGQLPANEVKAKP